MSLTIHNNCGSWCKLFTSEYFTIDLLLEYLIKKNDTGILDFLSNLLFKTKFSSNTFFYLPQLCSWVKSKPFNDSIKKFIISYSAKNPIFAVNSKWIFDSYKSDCTETSRKIFDKYISEIETSLINGEKVKDQEWDDQFFIDKALRLKQFDEAVSWYAKLKSMCEKWKEITWTPAELLENKTNKKESVYKLIKLKRKEKWNKYLRMFNKSIRKMVENNNKNISVKDAKWYDNRFNGYILPFETLSHKVIVSFVPELSFCFSTKARIPVKITVECIDMNEEKEINLNDNDITEPISGKDINYHLRNDLHSNSKENNSGDKDKIKEMTEEEKKKVEEIMAKVLYDNEHPNEDNSCGVNNTNVNPTFEATETQGSLDSIPNPFEVSFDDISNSHKQKSKFSNFNSLSWYSFIAKANDDLRQEQMTMQLITKFNEVFINSNLPWRWRPYQISITSASSGLIEFLPNTISIDALKQQLLPYKCTFDQFFRETFKSSFIESQKNFVESWAAYSVVCYLVSIKDRHNGNILLDNSGRIIHIDFGFVLGISPGNNMNFENAPFKITKDYINIMDGVESEIFMYFKTLFVRGIMETRKHVDVFANIVEAMSLGVPMPCFNGFNRKIVWDNFKDRFWLKYSEVDVMNLAEDWIAKAVNSWRTTQYDIFQKLTNGILP